MSNPPFDNGEWNALFCVFGLASNVCGCAGARAHVHDDNCIMVEAINALERVFGKRIARIRPPT